MNRRIFLTSVIAAPLLKIFKPPCKPFLGKVVTGRMSSKHPNIENIPKQVYAIDSMMAFSEMTLDKVALHYGRHNGMASLYKQLYGRQRRPISHITYLEIR